MYSLLSLIARDASVLANAAAIASAVLAGALELVERRNCHERLHPARQIALATLIESMPEAVFLVNENGKIIEANHAAERLTGVSKADLTALPANEVPARIADPHGLSDGRPQFALYRALRGESVQHERHRLTGSNWREGLISANPVRDADGRIVGALVIVRDITELAELQEHFAETERQNAIGTMAASLTHDFNNVLDTISKAATVLEVAPDRAPDERALVLRMIQNAVNRGAEIVGNVRQFLTGNLNANEQIDLNTLLEETIELTRPMWQASRVSLIRQFQPVAKVEANAAELRRVFTNLILNAVEAMPNGGTLIVGCEQGAGKVLAFVADTGKGIPPDAQGSIFVPYFTTKEKGTGLGLSSSLRAIRAQRGDITFSSKVGEGSRFVVQLPALENSRRVA